MKARRQHAANRVDGRLDGEIRPMRIHAGTNPYAEGSAEVSIGSTKILVTATIDQPAAGEGGAPGGIAATLNMLPRSTHLRIDNPVLAEALRYELQAVQSLIVRSLRAAVPAADIDRLSIRMDCSIACSDAGIASAAIAGSWVALYQALHWAGYHKLVPQHLPLTKIAAIAGGLVEGRWLLDLCAEEASRADFIANIVFDEQKRVVDIKATREVSAVHLSELTFLMQAASEQIGAMFDAQQQSILDLGL